MILYDTSQNMLAKDLHPCVIGEIFLKWWRVNCTEYHDISFIKTLFTKIDYISDTWLYDAARDGRHKELFITLKLDTDYDTFFYYYCSHGNNNLIALKQCIEKGDGADLTLPTNNLSNSPGMEVYRHNDDVRFGELFISLELKLETGDRKRFYHFCDHDNNNLIALKQCIEEGDGTELTLPTNDIENSYDMEVYKDNMPVFRYNTAIFPPYGVSSGHWYLLFCYEDGSFSMVSLIAESQQDLLSYFESCDLVEICPILSSIT